MRAGYGCNGKCERYEYDDEPHVKVFLDYSCPEHGADSALWRMIAKMPPARPMEIDEG